MTDEKQDKFGKIEIRAEGREDATARTEIPLRILVLGDFAPDAAEVKDWEASSRLINVTPASFQSVMQQIEPRLSLDVPNRVSASPKELALSLSFADMKAFRPEGIVQQVDALSGLLEIRKLVERFKTGEIKSEEFDEQLKQTGMEQDWIERLRRMLSAPQAPPEPEKPAALPTESAPEPPEGKPKSEGGGLDALLDMVEISDEKKEGSEKSAELRHVDSLMRAIAGSKPGEKKAHKTVFDAAIDELDQTLSGQINEILHHSKFQQLESAWRGLKFLIDRTDFRENIRIEVLSAHKDELRDAVYHQVFTPEYNDLSEFPLLAMIADYDFDRTPEDIELLTDIAQIAASINASFIASAGNDFFGVKRSDELAKLPMLRSYFQRPEFAKWNALRDNEDSQYISLTMPRFLLRFPYGPDGIKVKEFNFVEADHSSANHLWGRGVFAVAAAMVRGFAKDGWCIDITGQRGGMVENLPVWYYRAGGREVRIPLDVLFTQSVEKEFMDAGFVLLSSRINDDKAAILSAPTIYRPKKYTTPEETKEAQMHATLPYQLFATHMVHYLQQIEREVSTGLTAEQLKTAFAGKLRLALAKSGAELPPDSVAVEVSDSADNPGYYRVALSIIPPFRILGRDVHLIMGLDVHR